MLILEVFWLDYTHFYGTSFYITFSRKVQWNSRKQIIIFHSNCTNNYPSFWTKEYREEIFEQINSEWRRKLIKKNINIKDLLWLAKIIIWKQNKFHTRNCTSVKFIEQRRLKISRNVCIEPAKWIDLSYDFFVYVQDESTLY